jgi:isoleucyl-tRNA synthetase
MFHILEAMVRWITPILPFTSDEIWQTMPGERGQTIFTEEWYTGLQSLPENSVVDNETWELLADIRLAVNKQIEVQRSEGKLGGSLEAEVTLYLSQDHSARLAPMKDELRFILITSKARILAIEQQPDDAIATGIEGVTLCLKKSKYEKCERCWHRVEDIGIDPEHPTICGRCVSNVVGDGEERHFA